ncbi:tailspike protein [Acinetobacter phage APK20]|uniref:Tailspike protein n=1 Tax=Acinetobacter phage APK20 TaxID=2873375 RepID=A0AAE8XM00_9CAUD|nr:tailspike protein [Acinetobacter phage APK20]
MNTLRSFTETVVTAPTDTFPISFEFDEKYDVVHVYVDGKVAEDEGYNVTLVNPVTLKLTPAVPEGVVRIERETDIDKMRYIFDAGALFIDQNVDADFKQLVHSQQEVRDGFIKLRGDVLPLVAGLEEALQQAKEASDAAQEAADAAEAAANTASTNLQGTIFTVDSMADLSTLDVWSDRTVYVRNVGVLVWDGVEWKPTTHYVTPEMFGAVGDGVTDDLLAWQTMLDTKPHLVHCNPNATYYVSAKVYSKAGVVIEGNGATYVGPKPITSVDMVTSSIVGAHSKDTTIVTVADGSLFSAGDRVMVYFGQDNSDAWYNANQRNPDALGITSQITNILSVSGNTLTLSAGLDSDVVTGYTSRVQIIYDYKTVIKHLNIGLTGTYYDNRNACGVQHYHCHFYQAGNAPDETTYRDQTSFNTIFGMCTFDERLKVMYGYGSYAGLTIDCEFKDGVAHDGVWITYAGPVHCHSVRNRFYRNNSGIYSSTVAGVYIGAKSRYCHSIDDYVDGLAIGFRVMFGAMDCQVIRFIAQHTKSTYHAILTNVQRIKVIGGYFSSGQFRTLDVDDFELTGNTFKTSYRGVGVPPLVVDLNRASPTVPAKNYVIKDNVIDGELRTWVAVDKFEITGNTAALFNSVTSAQSFNVKVHNNTFGWLRLYNYVASVVGNKIDYSLLDATAYPKSQALELYGNTWLTEFSDNHIVHPSLGVEKTGGGFNVIALGENMVKAPVQYSIATSENVPPTNGTYVTNNISVGFKARLGGYGVTTKAYWVWSGSAWVLDSDYGRKYTYNLSFNPVANGVFTASPRTITGIAVDDNVIIDSPSVTPNIGQYFAKVTAPNTLSIYYKDYSGLSTTVSHTVYLTILK